MLGLDQKPEGAFGAKGYLPHDLLSKGTRRQIEIPDCLLEAGNRNQLLVRLSFAGIETWAGNRDDVTLAEIEHRQRHHQIGPFPRRHVQPSRPDRLTERRFE